MNVYLWKKILEKNVYFKKHHNKEIIIIIENCSSQFNFSLIHYKDFNIFLHQILISFLIFWHLIKLKFIIFQVGSLKNSLFSDGLYIFI